jgi:predicted outer membrane protein
MSRYSMPVLAAAFTFAFANFATAADPPVRKIDPAQPVGTLVDDHATTHAITTPQQNDERIVRWLSIDTKGLMHCARGAFDRSGNSAVKQFAKEVADDHQQFQDHFGAKADDAAKEPAAATSGTAALVRDDGRSRDNSMIFRPTDFLAVKEKINDEAHSRAKKEMGQLSGAEFDDAFLAHMIFGHEMLEISVDVLNNSASSQLHDQLKSLRDMADRHLQRAKELQTQFHTPTTAARDGAAEQK